LVTLYELLNAKYVICVPSLLVTTNTKNKGNQN